MITGPSGSGKSSLAFDVIFAEGQRRFMESMSAYARQFVQQMSKPNVDDIEGMQPTVAIEQKELPGVRESQRLVQSQKLHSILDCSTPSLEFKLAMLPVNHWKNPV